MTGHLTTLAAERLRAQAAIEQARQPSPRERFLQSKADWAADNGMRLCRGACKGWGDGFRERPGEKVWWQCPHCDGTGLVIIRKGRR